MYYNKRPTCSFGSTVLEPLEPRRMLSQVTVTTIKESSPKPTFGQTVVFTVKVATTKHDLVYKGTVELFANDKVFTGERAEVDTDGIATFTYGPGFALDVGTGSFYAHYVANSEFTASTSKKVAITVEAPKDLTTASDGLETQVITAGSGVPVEAGDQIVVEDTGYGPDGLIEDTTLNAADFVHFTVQANPEQVDPGEDQAVIGLKDGEVIDISIPAAMNDGAGKELLVLELISVSRDG